MHKQALLLAALLPAALLSAACNITDARIGIMPPAGKIYNRQRAPLYFDAESKDEKVIRSAHQKAGTSAAAILVVPFTNNILSFGWGNASMEQAARNGGISNIHYADTELFTILGVYNRATVIVYGE